MIQKIEFTKKLRMPFFIWRTLPLLQLAVHRYILMHRRHLELDRTGKAINCRCGKTWYR